MKRRQFLKTAGFAAGATWVSPLFSRALEAKSATVPLLDLHVHLTETFTIEKALALAEQRGVQLGIVEHPVSWALKDDEALQRYLAKLRGYPVYVGLQPVDAEWRSRYSSDLLAQVDYVLQDPQIFTLPDGEALRIWEFDTYVADAEAFMERYVEHSVQIIRQGNIDIFGWPLFLPVCIARDYYQLWTQERQERLLLAAKAAKVAIEINDMAHTPHEDFLRRAKAYGLRFTLGSDSRNTNVGRLDYCRRVIHSCGLEASDFWVPARKGS